MLSACHVAHIHQRCPRSLRKTTAFPQRAPFSDTDCDDASCSSVTQCAFVSSNSYQHLGERHVTQTRLPKSTCAVGFLGNCANDHSLPGWFW